MSTLQQVRTYYANALHVPYASAPADLATLAGDVDAGRTTFDVAVANVERRSIQTTGVAELSYQFFTGASLRLSGLDYLVSPNGPNPNNLNSAYYQGFNLENRYINFAINLGTAGEGAARFAAAYGSLSLADTLVKSYTEIFGYGPTAQQRTTLLGDMVPNGRGGTYTRADYFADIGHDGLNGLGTKAALVGWLLAQAAKEDVGVYAKAEDALIADLAPDGLARFNADLLTAYGPAPASTPGATISFTPGQSVSPTSTDATLRSTNAADTITGTGGVDANASVVTGNGNDTLTIPGVVTGSVTLGSGNDTVRIGGLGSTAASVPVLGAPPTQYGSVTLGGGNDVVYLNGGTAAGTTLAASGTSNVLHLGGSGGATYAGTITGFQTVYLDAAGSTAGAPATGVLMIYDAIPTAPGSTSQSLSSPDLLVQGSGQTIVLQNTGDAILLQGSDPSGAALTLDHVSGAPTTNVSVNRGFYSANGGSITVRIPSPEGNVSGANGTLVLNVVSNSTAGLIYGYSTSPISPNFVGAFPNLVIAGLGSLTAQIASSFTSIDASAAGDFNLSYTVATESPTGFPYLNTVRFSSGTDTLNLTFAPVSTASLPTQSIPSRFIFGTGADTIVIGGPALANLSVAADQTVFTPSEIVGFKHGIDHLVLDAVTATLASSVQAFVGAATTLTQALINVSSHVAANTGAVFEFAGDTYVYQQDGNIGVNTGDGLIRLVGVTGLSTASGSGVGDIRVHG